MVDYLNWGTVFLGGAILPTIGWTLNKVITHDRKIGVLENAASDIAEILKLQHERMEKFDDRLYDHQGDRSRPPDRRGE